ncbi:MAG: glycosyltransferase [Magnetococcus sp. DMHC-1]|nr:glycosyltransferase [Magnetococcales bacterium]
MNAIPRRPHILHTESSQGWGGQEIRILTEMQGFIQRNYPVLLVCVPGTQLESEARRLGIPVAPLPIGRKNLAGLLAMGRLLRRVPVDLIITHSSTDSWLAALATRFLSPRPHILRMRHISAPVPRNWPTRWVYTRAAACIVTTGNRIRQQLIEDNGFTGQRIVSIPTGIDLQRFHPAEQRTARQRLGLPENALLIGIVATLRSWKGHADLVAAFATLDLPNVHLLIIGDGPQRENLQQQIRDNHLADRVIMAGNQDDVPTWLQALDMFCLPSYANEGVPQALMQAMCTALPVISTTVGAIPELVEQDKTGILVPPRDIPALAQALRNLLQNPQLRRTLGNSALLHAQTHCGLEIMLDRMEQIVLSVLGRKSS